MSEYKVGRFKISFFQSGRLNFYSFLLYSGGKIALIGEQSKWVPVSPKRVLNIDSDSTSLQVQLQGARNETVEFSFMINDEYTKIKCHFVESTLMKIIISFKDQLKITCN